MSYGDSDFFLALVKESDWLKESARSILPHHQNVLWTSGATIIELLFICKKIHLDPEKIAITVFRLCEVNGIDEKTAITAAHYMKKYNSGVMDSIHAAYAVNDQIISSDAVFDELGIKRIPLGKR